MTLAQFEDFYRRLPERSDSERSWTIDFTARLQKALDDAAPLRTQGETAQAEAKALEAQLREKRKAASTKAA